MKSTEEMIWDYLDGLCSPEEKAWLESQIKGDPLFNRQYQELLQLHNRLNALDLEEPPMSFSRNVMEQVALEAKPVVLKTRINKWIINSIAAFFSISLLSILVYSIYTSKLAMPDFTASLSYGIGKIISPSFLKIFLIIDSVLVLVYLDFLLRTRKKLNP